MQEPTLLLLTALADDPRHGCAIAQEAEAISGGRVTMRNGRGAGPDGAVRPGIALYLIHRFGPDLLLWLLAGFAWCYTLTVLDDRVASHADSDWAIGAAVPTGFLVLLALAGPGPLRHVQLPVLVYAGALTYPFYLVHQSLGIPVTRGILKAAPGLGLLTSIALGLLASLLLAAALNGLIDQKLAPKFRRGLSAALDPTRTQQRPVQGLHERHTGAGGRGQGLSGAAKPRSAPHGQARPGRSVSGALARRTAPPASH